MATTMPTLCATHNLRGIGESGEPCGHGEPSWEDSRISTMTQELTPFATLQLAVKRRGR